MAIYDLTLPLTESDRMMLRAGDVVRLTGYIYTARDAAHKRIVEAFARGENLPDEAQIDTIYYCGPTPTRGGEAIGSCGPTTSTRMDDYAPTLIEHGNTVMIGKGKRSQTVIDAMIAGKAVYLVAVGGAAALLKSSVDQCQVVAYEDLGCEAIHRLHVKDMQLAVAIDAYGNCILK